MKWKPYPAYKSSGVDWLGSIPVQWEILRLRHACSVNPPKSGISSLPASTEVSFLPMEAIGNDGQLQLKEVRAIQAVWQGYPYFKDGDVIVAKITPCFENGKGGLCAGLLGGIGFGTTELHVLRPDAGITSSFLFYLTKSHPFRNLGIASMQGAAGQQRVTDEFVKDFRIAIPRVPEQVAIAAFLDRETAKIDALVAKRERLIGLLQEKRSVLITDAVTKSVRPSAHMKDPRVGWISEIPAHWDMRRLKFATSFVTSGSRGWAQHYSDEGAIFLRIGNLSRTGIELQLDDVQYVDPPAGAEGRRTKVGPGDLLVSITAYIGSVGVAPEGIGEAYVNQHLALARLRREVVDPRWAAYCLLSHVGQPQLRLLLYGGTKDGLGLDDVKALELLVPPLAEQSAIVRAIDKDVARIDELVAKVRDGIRQLREYRVAVISAAVTGRIDVLEAAA